MKADFISNMLNSDPSPPPAMTGADGTTSALAAGPSNGEAAGLVQVRVDAPSGNSEDNGFDEGSAWSPERSSVSCSRRWDGQYGTL